MTGVEFGHLDIEWIFDCLDVGKVTLGGDPVEEPCLFLSHKGVQVAEEYLQARYRLYTMVYMHKTTRAAEVMLRELLEALPASSQEAPVKRLRPGRFVADGQPTLGEYLSLDDAVAWAELSELAQSPDAKVCGLARRLLDRRLYKCFDLGAAAGERDEGNRRLRFMFMRRLKEVRADGRFPDLLVDHAEVAGYKWYDFESTSALEKVLVKRNRHDPEPRDIAEFSSVAQSLIARASIHRLYVPSA
ncbi:MAG: hypothetical protein IRY94_07860, partial [Rhodospirillaceae bacterium]|nr:hypothetical protein [Rhodospirillaceae bacterium]